MVKLALLGRLVFLFNVIIMDLSWEMSMMIFY